jgi:hypothetical protein
VLPVELLLRASTNDCPVPPEASAVKPRRRASSRA